MWDSRVFQWLLWVRGWIVLFGLMVRRGCEGWAEVRFGNGWVGLVVNEDVANVLWRWFDISLTQCVVTLHTLKHSRIMSWNMIKYSEFIPYQSLKTW